MYKVERDDDIPAIKASDKIAASKLKRHIKIWFRWETKVISAKIGKREMIVIIVIDIA